MPLYFMEMPLKLNIYRRYASTFARYAQICIFIILSAYFIFGFFGSNPFSGGHIVVSTGSSNPMRQVVLVGLFVGALPIMFLYRIKIIDVIKYNPWLILIYMWLSASILWSTHPSLTIRRLIAEILVFCILVTAVAIMRSWRMIIYPAAVAGAIIIVADIATVLLAPGVAFSPLGAIGVHTNKNLAGLIMLISLILCGGIGFAVRNWVIRSALVPIIACGFVFLFLTQSKTSLGLAVLIYVTYPALYLLWRRWTLAPAVVPVAGATFIALSVFLLAAFDVPRDVVLETMFGDATLTRRTELWAFLQGNIAQHPYLGSGWGAFWDTGSQINPINAPPQSWVLPAAEINTAHNGYIDIWVQTGAVGLALVIAVIARSIWVYGSLLRLRNLDTESARLIATAFAVLVALVLYNFLESILFRPSDCLSSFFVLAVLAGEMCYRNGRHQRAHVNWPAQTADAIRRVGSSDGYLVSGRR